MRFQKGDQQVVINGTPYGLRLTMGALAEITSRLSVDGPQELSARLRRLSPADGRVLLACLMRPCPPSEVSRDRLAATLSDAQMSEIMPFICKLFEEAFQT